MKIKIDMRETELITLIKENMEKVNAFKELSASSSSSSSIEVVIESLPLGDIILTDSTGKKDVIIIERKSLSDLTASIKDGRYEEQSFRLHHLEEVPNHNIIYLIEGGFSYSNTNTNNVSGFGKINKYNKFNNSHSDNDKCMLYSAMFSVLYYKGFSVFRTNSLKDTAFFICNTASKLFREEKAGLKKPFYSYSVLSNEIKENISDKPDKQEEVEEETLVNTKINTAKSYSHVVKKVKKDNITPENIGEIMLCQIPGVSSVTAVAVMDKYKTIPQLISCMKENPDCLKDITYVNDKLQTRKLNKTVVENIGKYLGMM
jgi:ERCC4-type nuclease